MSKEKEIIFTNQVNLEGRITEIIDVNENMCVLYTCHRNGKDVNFPTVLVFDEMVNEVKKYKKGDYVKITAKIESRRKTVETENKEQTIKVQNVILTEIEPSQSILEKTLKDLGISGRQHTDENSAIISGTLNNVKHVTDNFSVISMYVVTNNRPNLITFSYYGNKDFVDKFEKGDNLVIVGTFQTKFIRNKDNKKRKKEQIVIKEITKLD